MDRNMIFVPFFLVILLSGCQSLQFEGVCGADKAFQEVDGIMKRELVVSEIECASLCNIEESCKGYNFLPNTLADTAYNCELINTWSHNCSQTVQRTGWKFVFKVRNVLIRYSVCMYIYWPCSIA